MSADDGVQIVRDLHDAFNARDREGFLALLADDVVWHVEGENPMAGVYHGRDGAWEAYFGPLWASPQRYRDGQVLRHGEHVVALAEVVHNFGEGERAWETVEVLRVVDGRVTQRWATTSGQRDIDSFMTRGCAADVEAADLPS